MFWELMNYLAVVIAVSGCHSIEPAITYNESHLFASFCSGITLYEACNGSQSMVAMVNGLLTPKWVLDLFSSFYSLFETVPACFALKHFLENLSSPLPSVLPVVKKPSKVVTFGATEWESCLSLPSRQILDRYNFHSVLKYLLLMHRFGLENDWSCMFFTR